MSRTTIPNLVPRGTTLSAFRNPRRPSSCAFLSAWQSEGLLAVKVKYYIEEGELEVAVGTPGGAVKIVHVMPQGSIFGELQVFTNLTTSPVTVTARRPSLLRRTPHEAFRRLALSDPEFAAEVMSSMSFKALSFLKQVEDLAFRGVRKRIAYVLYALFSGSADDSVSLAIAQEAIADLVAAHRVTVTLALKELQEAGMIAVGRGRLFLLDEARLLAEALSTDR